METALTAAKMAEACGCRKHEDSINAICIFKDKPRENRNAEKNEMMPDDRACTPGFVGFLVRI
jgi:hypothetical protein